LGGFYYPYWCGVVTNLVSAYSGGLALKNLFPKIDRYKLTILAGLIGTILAAMNIIQRFVDYLTLMGVIYGPIAGVLWVEYYFVKKQYIVDKSVTGQVSCVCLLELL